MLANEIDIGIVEAPTRSAEIVDAFHWRRSFLSLFPLVTPGLTRIKSIRPDFSDEFFIVGEKGSGTRKVMLDALGEVVNKLRVLLELGSTEAVKKAVEENLGVSLVMNCSVTRELKQKTLKTVAISETNLKKRINVIHLKGKYCTPAFNEFVRFLHQAILPKLLAVIMVPIRNVVVYYTHQVPRKALNFLTPHVSIIENKSDLPPTKEEVIQAARDVHAICWFVTDVIDEEIILSCPNLRILAGFARGHDNIDISTATSRNIWVTIAPDTMLESAADLTWGLILSIARRITQGDRFIRSSKLSGWHPNRCLGYQVYKKTIGIIGMGRLGRAIARRAVGFEMTLFYCEAGPMDKNVEEDLNLRRAFLDELLQKSDFVCIAAPLTKDTFHQISFREISLMKPTAILINTARGSRWMKKLWPWRWIGERLPATPRTFSKWRISSFHPVPFR